MKGKKVIIRKKQFGNIYGGAGSNLLGAESNCLGLVVSCFYELRFCNTHSVCFAKYTSIFFKFLLSYIPLYTEK